VWSVPGDFATIQDAIDDASVNDGDTIMVGPGQHAGATVTKAVEIKGQGRAVINNGPELESTGLQIGFQFGFSGNVDGSGATISHLKFEGPDMVFPVFNHGRADDVSVTHCTMDSPVQGVTSWAGSYWEISHNVITDLRSTNGGAFGIVIADQFGKTASNNVLSHNTISGTFHVTPYEDGNHVGAGIALFADSDITEALVTNNRVVKNKISLVSNCVIPFVPAHGIALDENSLGAIVDNAIGVNDPRGTVFSQIILDPGELGNSNNIDRNLGDNRAPSNGLHPNVFGPGGN
jgi:hypothetical protein